MGVHFYHCHALPLTEHMHRGMYGVIVLDPDPGRVRESPREYVNYHGPIDDGEIVVEPVPSLRAFRGAAETRMQWHWSVGPPPRIG